LKETIKKKYYELTDLIKGYGEQFMDLMEDVKDESSEISLNDVRLKIEDIARKFNDDYKNWSQVYDTITKIDKSMIDDRLVNEFDNMYQKLNEEFTKYTSVFDILTQFEEELKNKVDDENINNIYVNKFNTSLTKQKDQLNENIQKSPIFKKFNDRINKWKDNCKLWELMLQDKVKTKENWHELLVAIDNKYKYEDIKLSDLELIDIQI